MKKIYSLLMLAVFALYSCSNDDSTEPITVCPPAFDGVVSFNGLLTKAESEYVGPYEGSDYSFKSTFTDPSGICTFTHYTNSAKEPFAGGFTYTNKTDITTSGYTNSSAITGKGKNGDTYLIASSGMGYTPAIITFDKSYRLKGAYFTNSTYAYLAMRDGNGIARKFTDSDSFKLTIKGLLAGVQTASVECSLAEGTNLVNTWIWIDLSSLGKVDELNFQLESTDTGTFGMNTPDYFCMDALQIIP